jgi:uncharacterized protein YbbK (DUF523 family)
MTRRPRVAVSACLLGEPVRWDGRDKREPALEALARVADLVPICPEVGVGMGVPREPVQLVRVADAVRLRGVSSGRDWTDALVDFARAQLAALQPLDGFVLKAKSPSCGLADVPVFSSPPSAATAGLFAAAALATGLPVIDEVSLRDAASRAAFVAHLRALP